MPAAPAPAKVIAVRKPTATVARGVVATALTGTVLLALGAFVLSFASLTDLAVRAGISHALAWIWPLIVDGLIVVSTVAIVALAGHGRRALVYPWALLFGGAAVSIAANALHAVLTSDESIPVIVSALVASVPPIVLLAVTHLAVVLVQRIAPPKVKGRPRPARASAAKAKASKTPRARTRTTPAATATSGALPAAPTVVPPPEPAPAAIEPVPAAPAPVPQPEPEREDVPAATVEAVEAALAGADTAEDDRREVSDVLVADGVRG